MLAEKNEFIKQSIVTLKELTADEKAKMQMEARERYRRDWVAGMELVREESREEIEALQNDLQKSQDDLQKSQRENHKLLVESARKDVLIQKADEESARKDALIQKADEESARKDEEIRLLKAQLAKANRND